MATSDLFPTGFATSSVTASYSDLFPVSTASSSAPSQTGSGQRSGVSGSLYLFTFLTTFILLLVISVTLFLRALFIRRRYRLHIQQTIAQNGNVNLPAGGWAELWRSGAIWDELARVPGHGEEAARQSRTRRTKDVGPPPKLWENELVMEHEDEGEVEEKMGKLIWDEKLQPVSLIDLTPRAPSPPAPIPLPVVSALNSPPPRTLLRSFLPSTQTAPDIVTDPRSPPSAPTSAEQRAAQQLADGGLVEIGVMIALPRPPNAPAARTGYDQDEGEDLPELMFGVMQASVVPDGSQPGRAGGMPSAAEWRNEP